MNLSLARSKTFIFLATVLLLFASNCTKVARLVESADPHHTKTYKRLCERWSREARIHRGLEVELIVSATFKSEEFRRAYADEYATAYKLTPEGKRRFVDDQLKGATRSYEFIVATFVPEKDWDDFDKFKSMWKLYLFNDKDGRVAPVEVRRAKPQNAVTPHFFPCITPWKSIYTVRFPRRLPVTNQPVIKDDTKAVKLVITSVLGTAEMGWKLQIIVNPKA